MQYAVVEHLRTSSAARARPLAELAGQAVLAHAEELARQWSLALIGARPLQAIGELPFTELAREAPALCEQVLQAMQSDAELERLAGDGDAGAYGQPAPARRLAAICAAHDAAQVVEAVEALRGVLWQALLDQLRDPSPRLVGDVCDRLAYVCSVLLAAALDASAAPAIVAEQHGEQRGDAARGPSVLDERGVARGDSATFGAHESPARLGAVIVDEHASATVHAPTAERRATSVASTSAATGVQPSPEIEIRDQRGEHGPAAWVGLIGAQLERFERSSAPFAVLLVELLDDEHLRRREPPAEFMRLAAEMEQALADALDAASGSLARERPGRCWLLTPASDRAGAERLAQRLAHAVGAREGARGERLAVAIGTAVCPDDGREAAALAAHADLGLYAARAAALRFGGERAASDSSA
jgi:GGDEF domain-containing protein